MADDDAARQILELLRRRYGPGNGTEPWDNADYLHAFGNLRDALLYSIIFLAEFVEVEGFVFLNGVGVQPDGGWAEVAQKVREAGRISAEALRKYVDSCNWVEFPYLVSDQSASDEEIDVLARVVAQAWRARLRDRFPDRSFVVRVLNPTETGSVVGVAIEQL